MLGVVIDLTHRYSTDHVYRNKQKEKLTTAAGYTKIINGEFMDMTDIENPGTSLVVISLTYRIPLYCLIIVNTGLENACCSEM